MAEALEDMMHKISLDVDGADVKEVFVDEDRVRKSSFDDDLCLVRKLLFQKPYNLEAMRVVFFKP